LLDVKVIYLIERTFLFRVGSLVFKNRVWRRIFGSKRDKMKGVWRKLHNEELHDLYCSPTIVQVIKPRRIRWAVHVAQKGEGRGVYRVLLGKLEGRRPLGRPRHRWEYNIKMDLQDVRVWTGLSWLRIDSWWALVNAVMNLRVP
jgi:hypothetical protein